MLEHFEMGIYWSNQLWKNSYVKPLGLILDIPYFKVNNDIKVYALR